MIPPMEHGREPVAGSTWGETPIRGPATSLRRWRMPAMVKRTVKCSFCGFTFETQTPFDVTRCQKCMKITKVGKPSQSEGKDD